MQEALSTTQSVSGEVAERHTRDYWFTPPSSASTEKRWQQTKEGKLCH